MTASDFGTIHIALFLPRLSKYGGVERFAWGLAEYLAGFQGYSVHIICARQETEPPCEVTVHEVGRLGVFRSLKILWFAFAAERVRREGGFDLSIGLGKTWNQDILRLSGGPLPVFWRLSSRAYSAGFTRRWKMFRRRLSPANLLIRIIERHQLQSTPHFVAVSHKLLEWMREAYPQFDTSVARVIYNKPDLSSFRPVTSKERIAARKEWGLDSDKTYIGTAGTNFALKGVGCLIRTLPELPSDYELLVAGGRKQGRYKRMANNLGVVDRVHFLGRVQDMQRFYHCCHVFVLASFYDACSNAVLEALSSGVPTLSTADNGSSFFLDPEDVIVDPRDTATLAKSIAHAVDKEEAGFSWPEEIRAGFAYYKELIDWVLKEKNT
ncbi:MAG: glycosyltransferase family 4 protein [Desulfonatronovibrionaceae bacterium]